MNKIYLFLITCNIIIFLSYTETFAQCTCMGGAAVGGITPAGGTVNIGLLKENNLRVSTFYRYSSGDSYLSGDAPSAKGAVDNYRIQYLGILFGYGVSDKITLESEAGYFPEKFQDFKSYQLSGSGFSHIALSLKYNLFHSILNEMEITPGIGVKLPLVIQEENLPQHLLPSTGANSIFFQTFFHKGFKKEGLSFFLAHRLEYNTINAREYQYGMGFFTSIFTSKTLTKESFIPALSGMTFLLEIRNEYRLHDKYIGNKIEDSGGSVFVLSPQLNYTIGDFNISALFDYPFYRYYNGRQLANNYSFGLNLTWQTKFEE